MTTIAQLGVDLTANSAKFVSELGKAQAALNSHAAQMNASLRGIRSGFDSVRSAAETFGIAIGGGAILAFAKQGLEAAQQIQNMARELDVSTGTLQVYQFAAAQAGVSQDTMTAALKRLSASIGEAEAGGKAQIDALNGMGVKILDVRGKFIGLEPTVRQIAEAYQRAGDKAAFAAQMKTLMGRAAQDLIPLLAGGAAGLDREALAAQQAGAVIGGDMLKAMKEANDAIELMARNFKSLATELLGTLAPALDKIVRGLGAIFFGGITPGDQVAVLTKKYEALGTEIAALIELESRFGSNPAFVRGTEKNIAMLEAERDAIAAQIAALNGGTAAPGAAPGAGGPASGPGLRNPLSKEDEARAQTIQGVIEKLQDEIRHERELRAAIGQSDEAIAVINGRYEALNTLIANKISAESADGKAILALSAQKAIDKLKTDEETKAYNDFFAALDKNAQATVQANQRIDDMIGSLEEQIAQNKIEAATVGMTAGQIAALNVQRQVENQLLKDNNVLTPARAARLQSDLKIYQETTDALARQKAASEELANFATSAFDRIGQAIDNAILQKGGKAFNDLKSIALSVIQEIENEFVKLALINPLKNALGIGGGNLPDLGGLFGKLFSGGGSNGLTASSLLDVQLGAFPFHSGGVVGHGSPSRLVPAMAFASAPRFHAGGFIGPGEVPIIARRGEGVLTPEQMAAMGGDTFVINNNFSLGVEGTVRAEVMQMMPQIAKTVIAATHDRRARGKVRSLA